MRLAISSILLFAAAVSVASADPDSSSLSSTSRKLQLPSAWDILTSSEVDYSGFVTAVDIIGRRSVLSNSAKSITLFAPTNNAFGALVQTSRTLLTNLYTSRFRRHLNCFIDSHIVEGVAALSSTFAATKKFTSRSGFVINVEKTGSTSKADGTILNPADVTFQNGVLHVMDQRPMLPPCIGQSIAEQTKWNPQYSTFLDQLKAGGLVDYLSTASPITVFIPRNAAWGRLSPSLKTYLQNHPDVLTKVLQFHVIPSVQFLDQAPSRRSIRTRQGEGIVIVKNGGSLGVLAENSNIASSRVTFRDIDNLAQNGIFHTIDDVLFPPSFVLPNSFLVVCFPGESIVTVKGKGTTLMKNVNIGDELLTMSSGAFHKVYSFGHYQPDAIGEYLELSFASGDVPLQISKDHMVFVDVARAVPAKQLSIGDAVLLESGETVQIIKISTVHSQGAYAPFTESGSIIVNGVVASNYIAMTAHHDSPNILHDFLVSQQWMAHASQAPHRLFCRIMIDDCKNERYTENGVSKWVARPFHATRFLLQQPVWIQLLVFVIFIWPLLMVFHMVEQLMMMPLVVFVCGIVTLVMASLFLLPNTFVRLSRYSKGVEE